MVTPVRRSCHRLRRPVTLTALVGAIFLAVAPGAHAQDWRPRSKAPRPAMTARPSYPSPVSRPSFNLSTRRPARAPHATVVESEPNGNVSTANLVALHDTVEGAIDPVEDIDYFALDIPAGTALDLDVDASEVGSALDPVIALFDTDSITILAVNDDFDGLDSRITYLITDEGRYLVGIVDYSGGGGSAHTYALKFGTLTTTEEESNDTPAEANLIAMGDTAVGLLGEPGDVDYFALDVGADTYLGLLFTPRFGGELSLYAPDGVTVLASVFSWDFEVRLRQVIATAGRYIFGVRAQPGAEGGLYTVEATTLPTGPGDPTTLFAAGLGFPNAMAALPSGQLAVVDGGSGRLYRVGLDGSVTTIAGGEGVYFADVVVDGFGDALTLAYGPIGPEVVRVSLASGATSVFATNLATPTSLTVGPDGDVWVADVAVGQILRYDPTGAPKGTISMSAYPVDLAFSPAGVLHFTDGVSTIYRVVGQAVEPALETEPYVEGIAFDADGYVYVANGFLGTVTLYDPSFQIEHGPFAATNLGGPITLAFGRTAQGAMTSRLFAANQGYNLNPPYAGGIVEMNPAGMRADGFRIGVDLLRILTTALEDGVVGADYAATLQLEPVDGPATWDVSDGALPPGLQLAATTGVISGIPEAAGTFVFTVHVDADDRFGLRQFTMSVTAPTVSAAEAADALLGVTDAVPIEVERYLDLQGNQNGRLDIGDLRAYLRSHGLLAPPAATASRKEN